MIDCITLQKSVSFVKLFLKTVGVSLLYIISSNSYNLNHDFKLIKNIQIYSDNLLWYLIVNLVSIYSTNGVIKLTKLNSWEFVEFLYFFRQYQHNIRIHI